MSEKGEGNFFGNIGTALGFNKVKVEDVKAPKLATHSDDFGDIYTDIYKPGAQGLMDFAAGPGFQSQWGTDPETGERVAQGDMAKQFQARQARVDKGVQGPSKSYELLRESEEADKQQALDSRLAQDMAAAAQMSGGDMSRAEKQRMAQQAAKGASKGKQNIRGQSAARMSKALAGDMASQEARHRQEQDLLGQDIQRISQLDTAALGAKSGALSAFAAPMQYQMGNINQNVMNEFQAKLANQAAQNAANIGQQQALAGTFTAGLSAATG